MTTIVLGARLVLAAVFAVAAVGKLIAPGAARRAVTGFGVPGPLALPATVALIMAEALTAAALVPASTATTGGIAALVLLGIFSCAVGFNLLHGRTPDCHCFGQMHSAPIGPSLLARNAVLAVAAGFVVADGGGPVPAVWWDGLSGGGRVAVVLGTTAALVVAAMAMLLWKLFVHYGRLLLRIEALEVAAVATGVPRRGPCPGPPIPPWPVCTVRPRPWPPCGPANIQCSCSSPIRAAVPAPRSTRTWRLGRSTSWPSPWPWSAGARPRPTSTVLPPPVSVPSFCSGTTRWPGITASRGLPVPCWWRPMALWPAPWPPGPKPSVGWWIRRLGRYRCPSASATHHHGSGNGNGGKLMPSFVVPAPPGQAAPEVRLPALHGGSVDLVEFRGRELPLCSGTRCAGSVGN